MSETRTRFLREITARIPAERLVELHLFPAMRQGAIESGVAVVAATPEADPPAPEATPPAGPPPERGATGEEAREEPDDPAHQMAMDELLAEDAPACEVESPPEDEAMPIVRHTVYTAHYRATLKGPERGKWEFFLVAEADAPLVTVDAVVRGVQRRSADAADPERLTPETLLELDGGTWATSTG